MKISKLFIGGYQELKRPINVIDDSLVKRMEEAGRRLRSEGKEIPPLIGPQAVKRKQPTPPDLMAILRSDVPPEATAKWPVVVSSEAHHQDLRAAYAVTTYRSGPPLASASNG